MPSSSFISVVSAVALSLQWTVKTWEKFQSNYILEETWENFLEKSALGHTGFVGSKSICSSNN